MKNPTREERISFWSHNYARSSFIQAQASIELLLYSNPPLNDPLRRALTVAIVCMYCRPFKQRNAVRLSGDTVLSEHRETHDTLIVERDKVIVHRDLDGPSFDWGFISQLQINFKDTSCTVNTISPCISNEKAIDIHSLLSFLIEEMDGRVNSFMARHVLHLPPMNASYVVSLEENPHEWLIQV